MKVERGQRYGAYETDAVVGEGGMAVVARATHVDDGSVVALKILTSHRRADVPGLVDRLRREAEVLKALAHIPYVVQLVDLWREPDDGADVLVIEYVRGRSLETLLGGPPLEIGVVLEWMGHACHALHDMHNAGYVHRDIKPDNLMLVNDTELPIRLIDFNSAGETSSGKGNLTRAQGTFPYTPAYLAPECFDGVPPDTSADVYALGMSFAEILLGSHPLEPEDGVGATNSAWQLAHDETPFPDLRAQRPEIPTELQKILEDCTAKLRRDRIPDAVVLWTRLKTVWDELQASETSEPEHREKAEVTPPVTPVKAATKAKVTRRRSSGSSLGCLIASFVLFIGLIISVVGVGMVYDRQQSRIQREIRDATAQRRVELEKERIRLEAEKAERKKKLAELEARADELAAELVEKQALAAWAKGVGTKVQKPVVEDRAVLTKLLSAKDFGSHHIYDTGRMGSVKVEDVRGTLVFKASQKSGRDEAFLEGVVTKVDRRGATVNGKMWVRYQGVRCGFTGNHRLNLAGHPHYFRGNADCSNAWHYLDIPVSKSP